MKVLCISADNIYLTPYLQMYLNYFDQNNINYKVLYWDKNQNEEINNGKYVKFKVKNTAKLSKAIGYLRFRSRIKKIILDEEVDFVICLHTICNLLIFDILIKKFKQKYIFDVRDYSYEKFKLVKYIEKFLAKNSALNIISSEGYKKFLPNSEYVIAHNVPQSIHSIKKDIFTKNNSGIVNISYIGLIRFMEQNKKIISFFKNDSRFHLNFIGTNADQLSSYCLENGVNNVTLIDTFDSKDTIKFFEETDMIMNLYGNHTPLLDYALSNKLYYAAILKKTILVCQDTYMESVSTQYHFGYVMKLEKDEEKDSLFKFYLNINEDKFVEGCNEYLNKVIDDQKKLYQSLQRIFLQK